jgi:hypothetical protein
VYISLSTRNAYIRVSISHILQEKMVIAIFSTLALVLIITLFIPTYYAQGGNPLENALSQIFGNLRKAFNAPGYTISLEGDQIFPNSTLKQNIVDKYQPSTYHIKDLKYSILGFDVTAHNINIHVNPSRIDATKTRVDIPLMLARNVTVTNGVLNLNYNEVNLGSIYGIYDKTTDKMTVHIPLAVASKYMHL